MQKTDQEPLTIATTIVMTSSAPLDRKALDLVEALHRATGTDDGYLAIYRVHGAGSLHSGPLQLGDTDADKVVADLAACIKAQADELECLRSELGRAGLRPGHVVGDVANWRAELQDANETIVDLKGERSLMAVAIPCAEADVVVKVRGLADKLRLYRGTIARVRMGGLVADALRVLDEGLVTLAAKGAK